MQYGKIVVVLINIMIDHTRLKKIYTCNIDSVSIADKNNMCVPIFDNPFYL